MTTKHLRTLLFWAVLMLCCMACRQGEEAPAATFVNIPGVALEASEAQGGSTEDISEVWVYADTQFVGAYHPPAEFPLLLQKNTALELFAGIRQNATGSDIAIYPFYESFRVTVTPGAPQILQPSFRYREGVRFAAIDQFESGNALSVDLDGDARTVFTVTAQADNNFATATVWPDASRLEVETKFNIADLPNDGRPFYLELDYHSDTDLQIGLRKNTEAVYLLQLIPNNDWTKVYVDLSDFLRGDLIQDFQLRFRAQHDGSTDAAQLIHLDNLKLVHFQS